MVVGDGHVQRRHITQVILALSMTTIAHDGVPHAAAIDICTGIDQENRQVGVAEAARSVQRGEALEPLVAMLSRHLSFLVDCRPVLDNCRGKRRADG